MIWFIIVFVVGAVVGALGTGYFFEANYDVYEKE